MGESIVAASWTDGDKIATDASATNPSLEVSVSFGRFENDSLSWEKWSTFSPNKYLEEVEKCATPGSVAQKKAYFEAHYKKIAARKAELLDQEKQQQGSRSDDLNDGDLVSHESSHKPEMVEASESENMYDECCYDEHDEDPPMNDEPQLASVKEVEVEVEAEVEVGVNGSSEITEVDKLEMEPADSVERSELLPTGDIDEKESTKGSEKVEEESSATRIKEGNVKFDHKPKSTPVTKKPKAKVNDQKKPSQKVIPMSKVKDTPTVKRKPASPVTQRPQNSTPRVVKPVSATGALPSSSRSSTKKVNGTTVPTKSKSPVTVEKKRVAPKSFHMSINVDTPKSVPTPRAPPPARESLIMEKMGDKDIVRRAFKTFQRSYNQPKSSPEEKTSGTKQVPSTSSEGHGSTSRTTRKDNGGSYKAGDADKRYAKAAPSSFGLKSDDRSEKRKELLKKKEEKSGAKEAETARLRSKSKDANEAEIRKLRKSLNFKATPMPGFYRGEKVIKSPLDKEGSKTVKI
ncbi:Protein WVD2-like 5 [Linum perenne]